MGFDVNEIRARCRRVLDFSFRSCLGLVKKYPLVSGVFLFFFFLYVSLPSVFSFLIFFLPLTVFLAVAFRLIFNIHQKNLQNAKGVKRTEEISSQKPTSVGDDSAAGRRKQILRRPQSVRRRNPKETISVQERVEEKDMVSSTVRTDDFVDKTAVLDENPKEIREVKVEPETNGDSEGLKPKSGGESKGRTNRFNGGLEAESSDDGGDEDEEETQEDRNKAVEWTEDDQKNLMDLGDSEMERNKRLESLIARRRARKLMSMQPRRTPMIASIMIPKNNPFLPNSSDDPLMSPTPGSAPSILLPFHNPFDIPYDPHEEKPNLTGGSFQDEFTEPSQKDMVFCRHESFSLGALFPGPGEFDKSRRDTFSYQSISTMKRAPEKPNYSLVKNETGEEDKSEVIQTESCQEGDGTLQINSSPDHAGQEGQGQVSVEEFHQEEAKNEVHREARNEVREEPSLVQDVAGGSSSSSSSELNAPFSTVNKDKILKSLRVPCPKNVPIDRENIGQRNEPFCDINPYSIERRRPEEHVLYVNNMVSHTPRHSIASDLQVELSEVGSPALTIDETISPSEGASPMYDEDVEKNTFVSEEKWVASSNLSKVEENESRSTEVPEITEQDIIDVGFARMNLKPEYAIESNTLSGKVVQIDSVDEVLPHSKAGLPENSETHSIDSRSEVRDEIKPAPEKSESYPSQYSNSQNLEDSSAQEVNVIYDRNNREVIAIDDKEILEFMKTTYGEAPISINFEGLDLSVPTMENSASSTEITQTGSEDPENAHVKSTKYSGGEFQKENYHNHIAEKSNLMGNVNVQDIEGEKGGEEIGSSGGNQNSDDPIASTVHLETVAEQGCMHSISPSSPKSMAEGNALTGQVSWGFAQTESKDQQFDEDKESHISPEKSTLVDAGFSGISQNDKNPISSAVQPDLVTERVSIALSSFSSPKPQAEIMLPVDHPISSSYINPEMDVKVQKSDEDVVDDKSSDKLLPEHLTPAGPRNVLNMSSYLTARLSGHKDPAELKDPPNTPMMFTKEQNSTYSVKTLKTIDETNGEDHLLIKEENAGALPKLSEQSISQCIDSEYMEGQSAEKMVEYKTKKSENLKDAEDSAYLNPVEYKNVAEIPQVVGNIDVLVSVQDCKEVGISEDSSSTSEAITAETGLHVLNQNSTSNPSSSADMPELVVEQVHTSSSSSSPNSVLQTKFSIASIASPDQQVPMGFQQPETEIDDNNKSSGVLPENLTAAEHQNPAQLMEDLTAHQSTTGDPVNLQEPSNSLEKSIKEDNVNCHANSSANDEKEEKLNSISRENGEGEPKVKIKHETDADPVEHSDVSSIAGPGGELEQLTGSKVVAGMSKPVEDNENSELRESMKSTDVGDLSVPTNSKDTAEANAVEEGKSKTSVEHEANDVGSLQPGQQNVISDIPVTSKEREEPLKVDQGKSSENVSVVDVTDGKEELRADADADADADAAEGETHRSMRTVAVAEQSGGTEKPDPSSTEAMVGSIQPAEKNDNLIEKEDMEETITTLINPETGLDPPTSVRSVMAPIM